MTSVFLRQPEFSALKPYWRVIEILGRWPEQLNGRLLRNGPALFRRGDVCKSHLLDGDGFAQCWTISRGNIDHKGAWIQTHKFSDEQHEQTFIYPGFSTGGRSSTSLILPDAFNTANTNLIAFNGQLLALWEAGSAHEICPTDLSTIGLKTWSEETAGAPFGAHPKFDREGNLWNIGISGNRLLVYVINPAGRLHKIRAHTVKPTAIVHDFLLTDHFIGVWLAPLELDRQCLADGSTLLEAMAWHDDRGSQLLLINRKTLDIERTFQMGSELIFHFCNAWESTNELIIQYIRSHPDALQHQLEFADGLPQTELRSTTISLNNGKTTEERGPICTEFPQIDQRFRGRTSTICFGLISSCSQPTAIYDGLFRHSSCDSQCQQWFAESGIELEEHVHVPMDDHAPEACGWLIGTGYDNKRGQSFCSVFDSEHISQGPLAIAYLDRPAPLCLHGEFLRDK